MIGTTLMGEAPPAWAQASGKIVHIGYLSTGTAESNAAFLEALKDALRELGYVDGRNIAIDLRFAGDNAGLFPQLAASLVKNRADLLVGTCIPSTRAAKMATKTIPVVMSVDGDPVAAGLVASLARPGGNVTGTSTSFETLIQKWLEFLHLAAPGARDVAVLSNPDDRGRPVFFGEVRRGRATPWSQTGPCRVPGARRISRRHSLKCSSSTRADWW